MESLSNAADAMHSAAVAVPDGVDAMADVASGAFWEFVEAHSGEDAGQLRLKFHGKKVDGVDIPLAITQIECRRKFRKKLGATLASDPQFLFPSALAGEQSTSDALAALHVQLAREAGAVDSVVDLTAGLGIDLFHFHGHAKCLVGIEMDRERADALAYNALRLCPDAKIVCTDCRDFLQNPGESFDVAFIDPARRADDGGRVFALADCRPDVTAMLPDISRAAKRLIVKMSPMLDITHTAGELPGATLIAAVGTPTECKELVAVVDFEHPADAPRIEAITMVGDTPVRFAFTAGEEAAAEVEYGVPKVGDYIVEPYPSIMKAGCRKLFAARYGLKKLAPNSNVYYSTVSGSTPDGVPARVTAVLPYASKVIKRFRREYPKVTIASRNFDITPEQLRHKLGTTDGGDTRLIATKDASGNPLLIVCEK